MRFFKNKNALFQKFLNETTVLIKY